MSIPVDEPQERAGLQPGRGGFLRIGQDGAPWVTCPSGDLVKSGDRKGLPKLVMYGAPSGYHDDIENQYNLTKWSERRIVLGVAVDETVADRVLNGDLLDYEVDSKDFKTAADALVKQAKDAAQADLAAQRGTYGHALTEDHDTGRDWVARAEDGEELGVPASLQAALVRAWHRMLEEHGLEVLATEQQCVNDEFGVAGSLDRIVRATSDIVIGGKHIPAGTVLVLDVKTGRSRRDKSGKPSFTYWVGYNTQVYLYASSLPYDADAGQRGEWPWEVSTTDALIAHLDIAEALETGEIICRLIHVDLTYGREAAECVQLAKHIAKTHPAAFTVVDEGISESTEPTAGATPADANVPTEALRDRVRGFSGADQQRVMAEWGDLPSIADAPLVSQSQYDAIEALIDKHDAFLHTDPTPAEPRPVLPPASEPAQPVTKRVDIDEGGPADEAAVESLIGELRRLDEDDLDHLHLIAAEAADGPGQPISLAVGHRNVRRFEIQRGLLAMWRLGWDDALVRELLTAATSSDEFDQQAHPISTLLSVLDATEAALFARLAHAVGFDADAALTATPADNGWTLSGPALNAA